MTDLSHISTRELEHELANRKDRITTYCPTCGKWGTYYGCSRSWNKELHCHGCRKPIDQCTC